MVPSELLVVELARRVPSDLEVIRGAWSRHLSVLLRARWNSGGLGILSAALLYTDFGPERELESQCAPDVGCPYELAVLRISG